MKFMTIVGIILIVLGVVAFAYQGITYTTREQVVDIGPVEVTKETKKTIPLPPILGGLALASGVVLMVAGARGKPASPSRKPAAVMCPARCGSTVRILLGATGARAIPATALAEPAEGGSHGFGRI
jgi:hypothetical protein